MVQLKVLKPYEDLVLKRPVGKGEIIETTPERAKLLLSFFLAEVVQIDKLKQKG